MCVPCEDNMPAACAAQAPFDYKMTYPSHFIDHPQESCFQKKNSENLIVNVQNFSNIRIFLPQIRIFSY